MPHTVVNNFLNVFDSIIIGTLIFVQVKHSPKNPTLRVHSIEQPYSQKLNVAQIFFSNSSHPLHIWTDQIFIGLIQRHQQRSLQQHKKTNPSQGSSCASNKSKLTSRPPEIQRTKPNHYALYSKSHPQPSHCHGVHAHVQLYTKTLSHFFFSVRVFFPSVSLLAKLNIMKSLVCPVCPRRWAKYVTHCHLHTFLASVGVYVCALVCGLFFGCPVGRRVCIRQRTQLCQFRMSSPWRVREGEKTLTHKTHTHTHTHAPSQRRWAKWKECVGLDEWCVCARAVTHAVMKALSLSLSLYLCFVQWFRCVAFVRLGFLTVELILQS